MRGRHKTYQGQQQGILRRALGLAWPRREFLLSEQRNNNYKVHFAEQ